PALGHGTSRPPSTQLQELSRTCRRGARIGLVERERDRVDDLEAVPGKAHQPERAVREPADPADAHVAQDLRADAELAEVLRPRPERGARRAGAVAVPAGEEVEPAPVAAQIEDHALALGGDPLHRLLEEAPRVPLAVREHVAGQVLEVRANE